MTLLVAEVVACPTLPELDHMHTNSTDNRVGAVVRLWCDEGYILRGASVITCYVDGHWSYYPVYCANGKILFFKYLIAMM